MQDNQKTFAVIGADGKIRPHFIAVANLESADEAAVRKAERRARRSRPTDPITGQPLDEVPDTGARRSKHHAGTR